MSPPSGSFVTSRRCCLFLHFVSFAGLYLPNGLSFYFGNFVVYLNSYWYARLAPSHFYSSWVISVFVITWSVTFIVGGNALKKINRRVLTFIGVLFYDAGIFASYFSVQSSQALFVITCGGICGVGLGFIQSEAVTRIPNLVAKRTGLAFAVLNNFFNIGAMFFQWLATQYANPDNLKAETLVLGHFEVFSQKSVIDRVPGIFLVVGILTSSCHLIGLILTVALKDRGTISERESEVFDDEVGKEGSAFHGSRSLKRHFKCYNEVEVKQLSGKNQADSFDIIRKNNKNYHTLGSQVSSKKLEPSVQYVNDSEKSPTEDMQTHKPTVTTEDMADNNSVDISQWQMLATVTCYIVLFITFANDSTYVAMLNFYKIFGQLWILDDQFLMQMGMAANCTMLLMRTMLGLAVDRFGVKTAQIFASGCMSFILAFYYFTPGINRWLFAVCTWVIIGLCSSVYTCLPVMILELFGQTDFASKYGIIATSIIVLNLIAPQTFGALLNRFGWSAVFLFPAAVNTLAVIFNVLWLRGGSLKKAS